MKSRFAGAHLITILLVIGAAVVVAQMPPVSWTCPMHPDVLEDKTGTCPVCGMALEPVRLVSRYTCPVHAVIEQASPGKCKICGRDLVAMTAALTWTCAGNGQINEIDPGTCPDGTPRVAKYSARAHGDHNPKHGGIFFMAPDNWHHIEGTYPAAGRFRLYVYDDYSKPVSAGAAETIRGRIVTKESFDPKTGKTTELASAPLVLARNGAFFEARIEAPAFPARMVAKIAFKPGEQESRFDFAFPALTRDLPARIPAGPASSASRPAPASRPAASARASLLNDLKMRQAELAALVKSGDFGGVYYPALQAKDVALEIQKELQARASDPERLEREVRQLLLAAYQLDNYGDLGDGEKINQAFSRFNAAVSALESLVSSP